MVMLFSVFVVLQSLRCILILHQEPWYLWVPWVWIDQEYSRTGKLVNCVCEGEVNETTRKCVAWQASPTCFSTEKTCQIQTSWSLWGDEMRFQSKSWTGHGSNISEKEFLHRRCTLRLQLKLEFQGIKRNCEWDWSFEQRAAYCGPLASISLILYHMCIAQSFENVCPFHDL